MENFQLINYAEVRSGQGHSCLSENLRKDTFDSCTKFDSKTDRSLWKLCIPGW